MTSHINKILGAVNYLQLRTMYRNNCLYIFCDEINFDQVVKMLLYHCFEYTIIPAPPIDDHFKSIIFEIKLDCIFAD